MSSLNLTIDILGLKKVSVHRLLADNAWRKYTVPP